MKKLFLFFCVLLPLTGCVIIEENFPELPEANTQMYDQWTDITFKTLTGKENLTVSRNFQDRNGIIIQTPDYNQKFLAVVLLGKDCEKSKLMAPYLNELATRILPKIHGMNYVPVFLDVYEDSSNKDIPWIKELSNIDFFMNAVTVCSDNACKDVLLPLAAEPSTASVYVVNTRDIAKTKKVYSWNLTDDPQVQAKQMEKALSAALELSDIWYDNPSIEGYDNINSNGSNI
ncbi:MAG: hypothetical protein ACI352_01550 [Elusimicrobiaceae bacterium]